MFWKNILGAGCLPRRREAPGPRPAEGEAPVILPKATKNAAEIAGARAAHRRDGVAMAGIGQAPPRSRPREERMLGLCEGMIDNPAALFNLPRRELVCYRPPRSL